MMANLAGLSSSRFVVLGRVGMDLYADPPGTRTEHASQFQACMGGSAANIAAAIVRLGGQADLVTCVSDDAVGRFCRNELTRYGIGAGHVRTVGGEARNSLSVVETRIEDTQSVIYRNRAADFEMTSADVEAVDYAAYGALVTTGTALAAEPSQSATFRALDLAQAAGLPVVFDVDYRPYSWQSPDAAMQAYARAALQSTVIVGNDVEFGFLAGGQDKGLAAARHLASTTAAIVIYKMGEDGAITLAGDQEFRTGIYPVSALKPTGAGDAFLGAFLASLACGLPVRDCVLHGSASAAIVVARVGCAPAMPTRAELAEFLATHPGPSVSS
jgi:5-dehydro-2-deoxygluconokinase